MLHFAFSNKPNHAHDTPSTNMMTLAYKNGQLNYFVETNFTKLNRLIISTFAIFMTSGLVQQNSLLT